MRALYPAEVVEPLSLPFAAGALSTMVYRPWLGQRDGDDVLFVSTHGYGRRETSR